MDTPEAARPLIDWQAVRADYEGGRERGSTVQIAARHGISTKTLQNRARDEGWSRRNARHVVDRGAIITRMFLLLDRQLTQLGNDMKQTGEKEVAVLGKLASTLEKLIDIDNASAPPRQQPAAQRKDMVEMRYQLAQRIAQLKRG